METNQHSMSTLESLLKQSLRHAEYERERKKRKHKEKFGWMDTQQAALKLNVCVRTIRNWTKAGLLPYSNAFGKTYYCIRDIEKLLKKNYTRAVPSPKPPNTPPDKG